MLSYYTKRHYSDENNQCTIQQSKKSILDQDFCRVSSAVVHGLVEKWNEQQYSIT